MDVLRPRLQTVRQKIRHLLLPGEAAGAAGHQGRRDKSVSAQQQPRALRAIEPLVTGHGNVGRPPALYTHRVDAGGLGGVYNQGDALFPADSSDAVHGQGIAEDIGCMGADHCFHLTVHRPAKTLRHLLPVEKPGVYNPAGYAANGKEGSCNGVMLIAGNDHRIPG